MTEHTHNQDQVDHAMAHDVPHGTLGRRWETMNRRDSVDEAGYHNGNEGKEKSTLGHLL